MKTSSLLTAISLALVITLPSSGQETFEQRKELCQNALNGDHAFFQFKNAEWASASQSAVTNALSSLIRYDGKCQVHMIYDPAKRWNLTFKFVRAEKEILVLKGHFQSVFLTEKNVLFFADYCPIDCGCAISAYDLDDGKEIWRTRLEAVGMVEHSKYSNVVALEWTHLPSTHDGITIRGKETSGEYTEVLDRKTGKQLAHKASSVQSH